MANLLPILLVAGGAAVVLGKKKKKKKASAGEYMSVDVPAPPPVKTKGPSGATASRDVWAERQTALAYLNGIGFCDCDPRGIDGKFGSSTRNAIMGFQDAAGIGVDGKWGKNTETAMASILSKAASGLVKVPKAKKAAPTKVKVGSREVYISPDYKQLKIGSNWKIAVLDKFLEERRRSGKLITDPKGIKLMDVVLHDPSQFLGELVGAEGRTAQNIGYAIYGTLWILATGGLAAEALAPIAGATLAESLLAGSVIVSFGAGVGASMHDAYRLWGENEVMAATALEAIAAFMKRHYVKVGSKTLRMDKIPLDKPAVIKLNKFILDYTYAFQSRTYEG